MPSGAAKPSARQADASIQALREAAAGCRECPLGEPATQTVWGEGPGRAKLMLVGEQMACLHSLESEIAASGRRPSLPLAPSRRGRCSDAACR